MAETIRPRAPSWSDLPSERRARLTVVIGRLAARHLASLAEETAHEPRPCAPTNQRALLTQAPEMTGAADPDECYVSPTYHTVLRVCTASAPPTIVGRSA